MANVDRWREVDELFDAALDLPLERRTAFLDERCPPELRDKVDTLIHGASRLQGFLATGAGLEGSLARGVLDELERGDGAPGEAWPGAVIDHYRLTSLLGEGGMGEVWEAEQVAPVRRRVALKLVRLGMDSKRVVGRFESERQALALMNHRNVAQVFDGGVTASGRPYFVMEFVAGVSVTEHCRARALDLVARLELFLQICEGVQHAHHKGIVHRDLKPSNILVAEEEGRPLPKIIDFGVARALEHRLTAATLLTEQGQIIGTPEYMSPEQADPATGDVDTRADVYALGVLLYELLAGVRPFDGEQLKALGFLELLRRIREADPPRPSQRVEPAQSRRLRGDLDWIVMKAIEKDRALRYVSAHEMAEDVKRHLTNQPVLAGPPSRTYRLKKLVRRHRGTVAAASLAAITLVAGVVVSAAQAVRATRAERAARADAETARQVSDFLVTLFEVSDPGVGKGDAVTARELLDRGAERLHGQLAGQPLVQARLQTLVGDIYRKLGVFDPAHSLLEEALRTRQRLLGPSDLETLGSLHALARFHADRKENDEAERLLRDGLERLKPEKADSVERGRLGFELGQVLRDKARYAEAEDVLRKSIEDLTRTLGAGHRDVGSAWGGLGVTLRRMGRLPEAETATRTALAIKEAALGPDHPDVAVSLTNLSGILQTLGRLEESRDCLQRALAIKEKTFGPDHLSLATTLMSLAALQDREGRLADSLATIRRVQAIRERALGPENGSTALVIQNVGEMLTRLADYPAARQALERSLAIERKVLGPDHPQTARSHGRLGELYLCLGQAEAAQAELEHSLAALERASGKDNLVLMSPLTHLAELALRRGRLDEADALLARALALNKDNAPNPELSDPLNALGDLRRRQGRLDEAQTALERAHALSVPDHPVHVETLLLLGDLAAARRQAEAAESSYRQALALAEKALGTSHPAAAKALQRLGVALARRGESAEAEVSLKRALDIRRAVLGPAHPDTRETARAWAALHQG